MPAGIYETPSSVHVADFIGDEMVIAERAGPRLWDIFYAEGATPIRAVSDLIPRRMQRVFSALRPESRHELSGNDEA
ncbi:hypothetical protein [Paracoccus sp. PAR01]|uniref:hypothetical protein n=1 Tax=Paracoccus sp. PAR01 TaxID=2769282 RepID=UPI001784EA5C|nr:hypothetical protein [Paracoccus sp. PAR01]MBD9527553.1 hypothetical protein [Paracoccus sp. PAR01]